jgi:serine/threonine protein kinase
VTDSAKQAGAGPRVVGRYALHEPIAAGGMAIVHMGRLLGPVGFSRTVAVKRVHPAFLHDEEFVSMFVDEARLAARIHHPNVVPTLDVVVEAGEILLVMEYVHGESAAALAKRAEALQLRVPVPICSAVITGVLHGLHAAHEAKSETGEPLHLVHRDVSPQNILVGADGVARVFDFGVAKAAGRLQTTREGRIKGKLAYMAPEQLNGVSVTRRTDIYAASVVAWEMITGRRLYRSDSEGTTITRVLTGKAEPPSVYAPDVSPVLDELILRGLSRDPDARFATAKEMALALEAAAPPALASEVAAFVEAWAGDALRDRARSIGRMESATVSSPGSSSDVMDRLPRPAEGATQSQLSVH